MVPAIAFSIIQGINIANATVCDTFIDKGAQLITAGLRELQNLVTSLDANEGRRAVTNQRPVFAVLDIEQVAQYTAQFFQHHCYRHPGRV